MQLQPSGNERVVYQQWFEGFLKTLALSYMDYIWLVGHYPAIDRQVTRCMNN